MATSRKTASVGSSGQIEIIITQGTQSTANNTSRVRVRGVMHNSSGRSYDASGVTRRISGEDSWSGTFTFDLASNESYTFIDQTFTVPHNTDGTKKVSYTIHLGSTLTGTFGSGGSVGTSLTLDPIDRKPGKPGTPYLEPLSADGDARVQWDPADHNGSSITEYQLQWSRFSDFREYDHLRYSTSRDRTINNLNLLTDYYFRVRAENGLGWGPWSTVRVYYVPTTPAKGPAPSLTHDVGEEFDATWGSVSGRGLAVTNYQFQVADNPDFVNHSTVSKGTTRNHTVTGATKGKTWYVRIRAGHKLGYGDWGAVRTIRVPDVPDAPGLLTVAYSPPSTVEVSWSTPYNGGAGIERYELQYSKSEAFSSGVTTISTLSISNTIEELDIAETYYFRARGINKQGPGEWSPVASKVVVSGPKIRHNGVWRDSIVWVKYKGEWRPATPYIRQGGLWRLGG